MAFGRPPQTALEPVSATGDQKWAEIFTADATGTIATITCDQAGGSSAQKHKAVIYSVSGGAPNALLGTSAEVTVSSGAARATVSYTFSPAVSVSAGTQYALGIHSESVAGPGSFYAEPLATSVSLKPLDLSGGETNPANRTTALEGDGIDATETSFGIWQQSTNLLLNARFDDDTVWATVGA